MENNRIAWIRIKNARDPINIGMNLRFISGIRPEELINDSIHSAGTSLTLDWSKTTLTYSDIDTTSLPKKQWNVQETLTFRPRNDLFINFSGNYGEVKFKERAEVENITGFTSTLQMLTSARSRFTIEGYWHKASGAVDETINSGFSAVFEAAYRALRGRLEYTYSNEENITEQETTKNNYIQVMVNTKRF